MGEQSKPAFDVVAGAGFEKRFVAPVPALALTLEQEKLLDEYVGEVFTCTHRFAAQSGDVLDARDSREALREQCLFPLSHMDPGEITESLKAARDAFSRYSAAGGSWDGV